MELVSDIYKTSTNFPEVETYGLTSQIRKSAVSIPSNIAEGFGRNHSKDFVRFLEISSGSPYELQTQLEISFNLTFLTKDQFETIASKGLEIEKMLNSLISKIQKSEHQR